jgi:hypothetical protein
MSALRSDGQVGLRVTRARVSFDYIAIYRPAP